MYHLADYKRTCMSKINLSPSNGHVEKITHELEYRHMYIALPSPLKEWG